MSSQTEARSGGCTCGQLRYSVHRKPLIVHCCHCSWCQRESGSAFAINAVIEASEVHVSQGEYELIDTPSASGNGQRVARCPKCRVAVWSNYYQGGQNVRFIRVGTLDEPAAFPPDVHIYTSAKQAWVVLPEGVPAFPEFYDPRSIWPSDSLQRYAKASASSS